MGVAGAAALIAVLTLLARLAGFGRTLVFTNTVGAGTTAGLRPREQAALGPGAYALHYAFTMDLAVPGQILMTRTLFDDARQYIREHPQVNGAAPILLKNPVAGATDPQVVVENIAKDSRAAKMAPPAITVVGTEGSVDARTQLKTQRLQGGGEVVLHQVAVAEVKRARGAMRARVDAAPVEAREVHPGLCHRGARFEAEGSGKAPAAPESPITGISGESWVPQTNLAIRVRSLLAAAR